MPWQIENEEGKYCSRKCAGKARSRIFVGQNNPTWKPKIKRICEACGKEFEVHASQIKFGGGRYCSKACADIVFLKVRTGKEAPRWLGGISFEPYCPKFNKPFKERVRKWFDYKCVICEKTQNEKKLRIHHVYYNKKACCEKNENGEYIFDIDGKPFKVIGDPNKFVALCTSCHMKTNTKRTYWARYFEDIINTQYNGKSWMD